MYDSYCRAIRNYDEDYEKDEEGHLEEEEEEEEQMDDDEEELFDEFEEGEIVIADIIENEQRNGLETLEEGDEGEEGDESSRE